jgi:hypothetical protein
MMYNGQMELEYAAISSEGVRRVGVPNLCGVYGNVDTGDPST